MTRAMNKRGKGRPRSIPEALFVKVFRLKLAGLGYQSACRADPGLAAGVNIEEGKVTNKAVAEAFGLDFTPAWGTGL